MNHQQEIRLSIVNDKYVANNLRTIGKLFKKRTQMPLDKKIDIMTNAVNEAIKRYCYKNKLDSSIFEKDFITGFATELALKYSEMIASVQNNEIIE